MASRPFTVESGEGTFTGDSVIVATGAKANWLGLESEKRLQNRGVSACATCDGALYRNKDMAVIGGGDSALEEALFLTRFANKVSVVHRRDKLRASKIMQERAFSNEKIEFVWDHVVDEVLGETEVTGIKVKNVKLYEFTVEISPGAFLTIPRGCVGEVPEEDPEVVAALEQGGVVKVEESGPAVERPSGQVEDKDEEAGDTGADQKQSGAAGDTGADQGQSGDSPPGGTVPVLPKKRKRTAKRKK